jgi:Predicted Fe-S oxidoreductases
MNQTVQKFAFNQALAYVEKDPEKNLPKLMDLVNKFAGSGADTFERQRRDFTEAVNDPDSPYHEQILRVFNNTDKGILMKVFENFFFNASLVGWKRQNEFREKYNCNIPWAILLDPTSACNLHCTGCWAAEYGNKLNLTFEDIDSIIEQGKEMGTYFYIYTGGEPLIRKDDIIKLCEKHQDCIFLSFTNATLIDEKFADDLLRVKNFMPSISIEGFDEATDQRRGKGTYDKVVAGMKLLKDRKIPFGLSCCYTSANYKSITSSEFFDQMIEWGASFVWLFHYMPVGKDAPIDLLPNPEQRKYVYDAIRRYRSEADHKDLFFMDFQNDAEYVYGCVAGGKRYLHINANGDCDPCVFIHYSNMNIHEHTLLEVLQSPLFMAYHDGQPFNDNQLRPCPMLENPDKIVEMVHKSGAHSTDLESPEPVEDLVAKTKAYAEAWKPEADKLWVENRKIKAEKQAARDAKYPQYKNMQTTEPDNWR